MKEENHMISAQLDTLFHTQERTIRPGIAVAIIREGQITYCQGHGLANMEWEQPVTPHTVFGLGSTTKPFTATAIMLLEQQGKLCLDDTIQTYLPEYPTQEHRVTLRHLLTHTSGIPNFVTQPDFREQHAHTKNSVAEVIALFKDLPFDFAPGTRYSYSNSGYVLLGHILERLLDMSYSEVIQRLIFHPLGMTHSYYLTPEAIIPHRASGYIRTEQGYQHARFITPAVKHAAGGLASTLEDMILWDSALREERLLDHTTQARMYSPVCLVDGRTENYGFGWEIGHYRQHHYVCHAGGIPGYSAFFGRFPDDELTIILLSNRHALDVSALARKIAQIVLDLPPLARTPVALHLQTYRKMVGTYKNVFGMLEVKEEEQKLRLHWGKTHTLVPMSETSFYFAEDEDVEVHFEHPNGQGIYERIRIARPFFWCTAEKTEQASNFLIRAS
jgi:CubicO group peptidase (beta-lactamase class C family)